jgi:L-alanine-DL-glutamate epimerase-like enolase superfamily enzyme
VKIARVDVYAFRYTLAEGPFVMSGGKVATEQDSTIVRLVTDDGLVGWGEQCPITPNYVAAHGEGARAALRLMAPALIGLDPRQPELVYDALDGVLMGHAYAKSAVDIACWDVAGRAVGLSVGTLIGGIRQQHVPVYAGVSLAAPERMRERCEQLIERGYRRLQIKLGGSAAEDILRVRTCGDLAERVGLDMLIFDANAHWPARDARLVANVVERYVAHLEQPCRTSEECALVHSASRSPMILDESLTSVHDVLRAVELRALDAGRLKLARFGGITPVRRARDLLVALGMLVSVEDAGGGDIATAATTQVAATIPPKLLLDAYLASELVAEKLAEGAPRRDGGTAEVSMLPGLGIEVDVERLGNPVFTVSL